MSAGGCCHADVWFTTAAAIGVLLSLPFSMIPVD